MKPIFLSLKKDVPASGYWDQTLLIDLLSEIPEMPESDRKVIIIPGAYQGDIIPQINEELSKYSKVLVFVTSDEECKFDVQALSHPDMILYAQYGHECNPFPIGYAPNTREILRNIKIEKSLDWVFSGQITHYRREQMAKELSFVPRGALYKTKGFSQGFNQEKYLSLMASSKIAPCAPGPISQDSFRLYEALEAGCVPVVDDVSPLKASSDHYIRRMFMDAPFPIFDDYKELPELIRTCLDNKELNNQVFAWWINMKFRLKSIIKNHLEIPFNDTVVIVPVSPIPSHPSINIVDETIKSIRSHVDSPILVTIDGVRDEQKDFQYRYREFIKNFLWKCNFEYKDVLPVIFSEHKHQSGMMKEVLPKIGTQFILYVEQDAPLTPDVPIEWDKVKSFISSGESNCVRFHFETKIPDEHKYLMIGEPENGFQKTKQWSQRPALYLTNYFKAFMDAFFSEKSNTFIEDRMYGILQIQDWNNHKIHIYHPEGSIKRSYHTDGRAGDKKYDDRLIY